MSHRIPESAASTAHGAQAFPYASYRQYVEQNIDKPGCRWLQIFFNHGGGSPELTRTTVLEAKDGKMVPKSFSADNLDRFKKFLSTNDNSTKFRVIVLGYINVWSVDRKFIDIIASHMQLHHLDLVRHLRGTRGDFRQRGVPSHLDELLVQTNLEDWAIETPFSRLPSEEVAFGSTLDLQYYKGRTTVYWRTEPRDSVKTVCVLAFESEKDIRESMLLQKSIQQNVVPERIEPGPSRHLCYLIASALIRIPTTELAQCEANAAFVCYYIIRLWLLRRYNDHFFNLDLDYIRDLVASDMKSEMEKIHLNLNHLCSVQHALRLLLATPLSKTSSLAFKFRGVNTDLEHLVQKTKKAMKFGTSLLNSELAQMQIEEAEKSKATAEGVASLTIVATVYIPLNFAASFFGMNMSAFGNGTVQLYTYVGAVLFIAALTFIPFVSQFAKWARSHPGLDEST